MKLVAIDCDLTVCPSDEGWKRYLDGATRWVLQDGEKWEYNLGIYYPDHPDPLQYWRELDYSQFQPIDGAVEKLEQLSKYFGIVFISSIKGSHSKSKNYWLKEHFPFHSGYLATKEKFLMNDSVCAMFDDRKSVLKGFDFHKRYLYSTLYTQEVECDVYREINNWKDFNVQEFIRENL